MKLTRRGWNNLLMLSVIAFILLLNAPTWIKAYLTTPPSLEEYPSLFAENTQIETMNFTNFSLNQINGRWSSSKKLSIPEQNFVDHWMTLKGTPLSDSQYSQLKPNLNKPNTLEVWVKNQEEPLRITYYETSQYWLFKNGLQPWIAISVEKDYLFPFAE